MIRALILVVFLVSAVKAFSGENTLSRTEMDKVVGSLNEICFDMWCEGDYFYSFNHVDCDNQAKSCTVNFEMFTAPEESPAIIDNGNFSYSINKSNAHATANCVLKNLSSFSDLMQESTDERSLGNYYLQEDFLNKLSDCIGYLEKNF